MWPPFRHQSEFRGLRHLRLSFSTSVYGHNSQANANHDTLQFALPILNLHLESLTIAFHIENRKAFWREHINWISTEAQRIAMGPSGVVNARRIIFDLPMMLEAHAKLWMEFEKSSRGNQYGWRDADWIVEPGPRTTLVYERVGSLRPVVRHHEGYILEGLQRENKAHVVEISAAKMVLFVFFIGVVLDLALHIDW